MYTNMHDGAALSAISTLQRVAVQLRTVLGNPAALPTRQMLFFQSAELCGCLQGYVCNLHVCPAAVCDKQQQQEQGGLAEHDTPYRHWMGCKGHPFLCAKIMLLAVRVACRVFLQQGLELTS